LPASRPGVGRNLRGAADLPACESFCAVFGCLCDVFFFDLLIPAEEYSTVTGDAPRKQKSLPERSKEKEDTLVFET
jgi:hypothetical protein